MANDHHHHVFILLIFFVYILSATWFLMTGHDDEPSIWLNDAKRSRSSISSSLRSAAGWLTATDRGGYRMTTSQKPDRLRLVSFFLLATVAKGLRRRRRRRRRYNHTAPITDDTTMFPFFPPLFQRLSIHVTFPSSFFLVFSIFCWRRICSQVVVLELLVPNDELGIGWHGAFVSVLIYKEGKSTTKGNRRKREKALAWSNSVLLLLFFFPYFPFNVISSSSLSLSLCCVFMYLLPMSQGSILMFFLS